MSAETPTQDLWTEGHYHSLWGTLRIAGVNNTMKGEAPHFASLMSPFLREGARVMIGGAADTGVLCGIGRVYAPRMPQLMVIDKCRAPLALIREFAAKKGLKCRTLHLDLLELDGREQWDQIILHYTADFMDARLRERLFRRMAASLAPGGVLVCAAMTGAKIPLDRKYEMESAFFTHVLNSLKDTPLAAQAREPQFEHRLRDYAACRTMRRLNLSTTQDTCELLQRAGLRVLHEHATSRARRLLVGSDVVDTSSIVVAARN